VTDPGARLDVVLNRLCLTRSRSEAKTACEAGAVFVDGRRAKPSQPLAPGQRVTLRYATRLLEVRLIAIPTRSIAKKTARELYEVVRDEPVAVP
jgi:ribosome-associated heat shock protein Hsp15